MEIGNVYAIWSAVGTALVAVVGVLIFHEQASVLKIVAIVLIIAGVVCLNLSAPRSPRTGVSAQAQLRTDLRFDSGQKPNAESVAASRVASSAAHEPTG